MNPYKAASQRFVLFGALCLLARLASAATFSTGYVLIGGRPAYALGEGGDALVDKYIPEVSSRVTLQFSVVVILSTCFLLVAMFSSPTKYNLYVSAEIEQFPLRLQQT